MRSAATRRAPVPPGVWSVSTRPSATAVLSAPKISARTGLRYAGSPAIGLYSLVVWAWRMRPSASVTVSSTGVMPRSSTYTPEARVILSGRVSRLYSSVRPRMASGGSGVRPAKMDMAGW